MRRGIGLLSHTCKDYPPIAPFAYIQTIIRMEKRDPFVEGLNAILKERSDLNPTNLAKGAKLDDSTVRKLINGDIDSLNVANAEKVAKVAGYSLSTIIAIGEHAHGPTVIRLALAIDGMDDVAREKVDAFLEVSQAERPKAPPAQVMLDNPDTK